MGKKLTTEGFIERAKKVHGDKFDYSEVVYLSARSKVKIICKKHGIFEQTPTSHLMGKGCSACKVENSSVNRTSNTFCFIAKARLKHGDKYDYSLVDYKKSNTKVSIICKKHGIFEQTPSSHLSGSGCPDCSVENTSINRTSDSCEFITKARLKHGNMYLYDSVTYVNARTKVKIICQKHGIFEQTPYHHISGKGCPSCSGNARHTFETLTKSISEKHNGKITLAEGQEIKGMNKKYKFQHVCGYEWFAQASSVLSGCGCPSCSGRIPYTFETLTRVVSEKHGGEIKLVSDQQIDGVRRKYKFQHTCGHKWFAAASNIIRGNGCPKCAKSGFDPSKPAVLYILGINGNERCFTGFGITGDYKVRKRDHKRNLKANNCSIVSEILIQSDGLSIQNLESYVKQTLQCRNTHIEGFKTESLSISPEELKIFCENHLQSLGISYTLSVHT